MIMTTKRIKSLSHSIKNILKNVISFYRDQNAYRYNLSNKLIDEFSKIIRNSVNDIFPISVYIFIYFGLNRSIFINRKYLHLLTKIIHEFIQNETNGKNIYTNDYNNFLLETERYDSNKFQPVKWVTLSRIAIALGLYNLSILYWDKYIQSATYEMATNYKKPFQYLDRFMAEIESRNYSDANMTLHLLECKHKNFQYLKDMRTFLNTFLTETDSNIILNSDKSYDDEKFYNYICGKSIAIVGPASNGIKHGNEIDNFDIVVRLNYSGNDRRPPSDEFGSKTDVSYYRKYVLNWISENNRSECFNDVKWVVSISQSKKYFDYINLNSNSNCRTILNKHEFMSYSAPNAIQSLLYDVLQFNPRYIKLFNINFYLTKEQHHSSYKFNNDIVSHCEFAQHYLIPQFLFVKGLYTNRKIDVDDRLKEILSMSGKDYVSAISKQYFLNINN